MKKVFITGANGFVGQHLIDTLKDHYEIIGLAGADKDRPDSGGNVQYVQGDINGPDMAAILEEHKPDSIIHLAAIAQTWFPDPQQLVKINVLGTINLLESVVATQKKTGSYDPKIIYIGSSEVYGKTPKPELISEDAPLFPLNRYAASKLSADRFAYAYSKCQGLRITIVRPFSHIGPGQREGFFVPDMVSQIVALEQGAGEGELLVGNLESVRDYLDVRDVVQAYKLLLEADTEPGETFNISSGKGVRVGDVLDKLLALSTKKIIVKQDPTRLRPSDVPVIVGDNTKLTTLTGWKPKIGLDQTLKDALEHWRKKT